MSYLDFPRITFAGSFLANPGTINNAAINYYAYENPDPFMKGSPTQSPFSNAANFPKAYRQYVPAAGSSWNPTGIAQYQFDGMIQSFLGPGGEPFSGLEGATVSTIVESGSSVGKLVDLDTNQQTLTQLFGLVVQLALQDGTVVFTAQMSQEAMEANQLPVLTDLWFVKIPPIPGDTVASGTFQWILDEIVWSQDASLPPAVAALKEHYGQRISIKINVDRYSLPLPLPSLTEPARPHHGRVVGALGPVSLGEPFSFVVGRRFEPLEGSQYWVGSFVLGDDNHVLTLDLGNSIPTQLDGTPLNLDQQFVAGTKSDGGILQPFVNGKNIPVTLDSYENYAGIVSFKLMPDEADRLQKGPLYLWLAKKSSSQTVLKENDDGWFVKPELSTSRMSAGDTLKIKFWTIQRGVLSDNYQHAPQLTRLNPNSLAMSQPSPYPLNLNGSGKPSDGLTIGKFKKETVDGKTEVGIGFIEVTANTITIHHDKLPTFRQWAGSQVYFLGGDWRKMGLPINPGVSIGFTILLWVKKEDLPEFPTWNDVKNLLGGYAAIYPGMRGILNIGAQAIVDENAETIRTLMSKHVYDPGYMPVTRDMSPADTQLVIRYLNESNPRRA